MSRAVIKNNDDQKIFCCMSVIIFISLCHCTWAQRWLYVHLPCVPAHWPFYQVTYEVQLPHRLAVTLTRCSTYSMSILGISFTIFIVTAGQKKCQSIKNILTLIRITWGRIQFIIVKKRIRRILKTVHLRLQDKPTGEVCLINWPASVQCITPWQCSTTTATMSIYKWIVDKICPHIILNTLCSAVMLWWSPDVE